MKHFIAFGHSHIVAVANAVYQRAPNPRVPTFVYLHDASFYPGVIDRRLNPAIRELVDTSEAEFILMAAGGNEHNLIGITDPPGPFDFVLPENPDLPIVEPEIVPAALVYATLARRLAEPISVLRTMAEEVRVPVLQIEPPPPIPDEAWIARAFAERGLPVVIRSRVVVHKLWRLQSMLYRKVCAECGIEFLPCPADAVDTNGMLVEKAWGVDATHANAWYGSLVLDQIERAQA